MLKQLSIYAENKKGTLQCITGILLREEINILGSVTNDSAEYLSLIHILPPASDASASYG